MKDDRRTQKTIKNISDAFLQLSAVEDYRKISVTKLCDRANINRCTFYAHYTDIFDFLDKLEMQLADHILEIFSAYRYDSDGSNLVFFVDYIIDNSDNLFILFDKNSQGKGLEKIFQTLKERTIPIWRNESYLKSEQLELIFAYMMNGVFSLTREWYLSGFAADKEWVRECLENVVKYGVYNYVYTK